MIEKTVTEGTERLYYTDSHMQEFTATVLSCEALPAEKNRKPGAGYAVVLDRTAFFPEGGGQFGDVGTLEPERSEAEGSAPVQVVDTREKDGIICHHTDRAIEPGTTVTGRLNWKIRFDRMQQHSGEHIISGLVNRYFGYENVGFHLGDEVTTLDFNGEIAPEDLKRIEYEANEAVVRNVPYEISFPTKEEEAKLSYRSKIEIQGQVRLVTVPGYDMCACCAPHVYVSGEIGIIRLVDAIRYKGGVRVTMLCGFRALKDYRMKEGQTRQISGMLSVPAAAAAEAVLKVKAESEARYNRILDLQAELLNAMPVEDPEGVAAVFAADADKNVARRFVNDKIEAGAAIAGIFIGTDETGYHYILGSRKHNLQPVAKELNRQFAGKGGGKPEMIQGSLTGCEAAIREFLTNWKEA